MMFILMHSYTSVKLGKNGLLENEKLKKKVNKDIYNNEFLLYLT
jgi:hypothetical protein